MTFKEWIIAATLGLLASSAAHAATEANFGVNSTSDLVALCSATPDNGLGTAAVNFCEGYLQGAVTVEMQNLAGYRGAKLFCLPTPPPTRIQTMSDFVNWARAAPDRMAQPPSDGLFGFLRERYPCPSSR